jgi:ABC-type transporter Mla MlaB component
VNPSYQFMAIVDDRMTESVSADGAVASSLAKPQAVLTCSPNFKYYIHDRIDSCRLQLFGQLGEAEVAELASCWQTAKPTLGPRLLVLDLRDVKSVDDAAKTWLSQMIQEGARCQPESFLRDAMASQLDASVKEPVRARSALGRLLALVCASRVARAEETSAAD